MGRSVAPLLLVAGLLLLGKVKGLCEVPGLAQDISVNNYDSTSFLVVTWIKPAGKVDNYTVTLTGDVNNTITTTSTQVNFTNLLPGRQYSIVIQTVSGNCNQRASPVTEATYPTPPQSLIFTNIGTNSISLSWTEPVNMANVTKTFNVTYRNSSGSWTVSSNTLNVTLQYLTSGTNYTITVVTVGARQYQSSSVSDSIYTKSPEINVTVIKPVDQSTVTPNSFKFTFHGFETRNGPIKAYDVTINKSKGDVAAAVVGPLLVIAVVGVLGYLLCCKRSKRVMRPARFVDEFFKQQSDSFVRLSQEYETFSSVGVAQSKLAAEVAENKSKNRYNNVLPYDISRVKLSVTDNPYDDYINASYIPGYKSPNTYIAAQGPLPQTVNDFWRMIWEKDVRAVVMLTRCVEAGKVKCEEYWPSPHSKQFKALYVSLRKEDVFPEWTIRDLEVINRTTNQSEIVRHFHFTAWPDHGVPQATGGLIHFRNIISDYMKNYRRTPILVHCSAGVGRTGTLIALDRIIKQIEEKNQIDVHGVVHNLWLHRSLMVQTEAQYIFLNKCAVDYIQSRRKPKPVVIHHAPVAPTVPAAQDAPAGSSRSNITALHGESLWSHGFNLRKSTSPLTVQTPHPGHT